KSIDVFSPYPEFLNFLVDKMVRPDIQDKTFYFDRINSYYQVQFNPLEMINNRYLVAMNDVSSYHQIMQAHKDFTANVSMAFQPSLDRIHSVAGELKDLQAKENILREASWLDELVNDTLALTSQTIKYKRYDIQVDQMIQEILSEFTDVIAEKSLHILANLAPIHYKSDPQRLQIIFKKLIGNALSYSHDGGDVEISLSKGSKNLKFDVKDSGPGLPEAQRERIFEHFYRTDIGISMIAGTGLGLAIVKKNVEDLNGHVYVQSEVGQGSTFTVKF
ncbi:MAG: two-component sensor histidine kinase, partial [Streptococcaceae bacterium]|nr:two-component sensor histidine kinase [Streptococcaceae bacterium]